MGFQRGLIGSDFFFLKKVFPKKRSTIYNNNFIKRKIFIFKKNFFIRRCFILKLLNEQNYFKFKHQPIYKLNFHGKKIYENGGIYIFSTNSLIFFKILIKNFNPIFLIKKIKFFLNEKLKTKRNLICIFERLDLLPRYCLEILENFFKKSKQYVLFVLVSKKGGNNIKKKFLKIFNYYNMNLENNIFKYYLKFKSHSKFLNRKILIQCKYDWKPIDLFLEDKINSCFFLFKTNSNFLFFVNFLTYKFFRYNKKIKVEYLTTLVQNSILWDYNKTYINRVINSHIIWNLNSTRKLYQKKKYIEMTLTVLISMKK